jgi:hypothetical protein
MSAIIVILVLVFMIKLITYLNDEFLSNEWLFYAACLHEIISFFDSQ